MPRFAIVCILKLVFGGMSWYAPVCVAHSHTLVEMLRLVLIHVVICSTWLPLLEA